MQAPVLVGLVIVSRTAIYWPQVAAPSEGLFADNGLHVELVVTSSSALALDLIGHAPPERMIG